MPDKTKELTDLISRLEDLRRQWVFKVITDEKFLSRARRRLEAYLDKIKPPRRGKRRNASPIRR